MDYSIFLRNMKLRDCASASGVLGMLMANFFDFVCSMSEERIDVKICKPECPRSKLCLPKCCNLWDDVSFQNDTHLCMASLEEWVWKPEIYEDDGYFYRQKDEEIKRIHFHLQDPSRTPNCTIVRLINYQHFE